MRIRKLLLPCSAVLDVPWKAAASALQYQYVGHIVISMDIKGCSCRLGTVSSLGKDLQVRVCDTHGSMSADVVQKILVPCLAAYRNTWNYLQSCHYWGLSQKWTWCAQFRSCWQEGMRKRWTVRLACRAAHLCRADKRVIHASAYRMHH